MSVYTEVVIQHDELSYTEYRFSVVFDTRITLESVTKYSKPSKRHKKYEVGVIYSRYLGFNQRRGNNYIEPELPPEIIEKAVAQIRSKFNYERWEVTAADRGIRA